MKNSGIKNFFNTAKTLIKWIILGSIMGVVAGCAGGAFSRGISFATTFRESHDYVIVLMPVAGLLIVYLYHALKDDNDTGTNAVLTTIAGGDRQPLQQAPLIFISAILSHLTGASVGKFGSAVQIGGGLGGIIGTIINLDKEDYKIISMSGIAGCVSAVFGTPMAAAFFAIEVTTVGSIYYPSLLPCALSAVIASKAGPHFLKSSPDYYSIEIIPEFTIKTAALICLLAVIAAMFSVLYSVALKTAAKIYKKVFVNPYFRIFFGGCVVAGITMLSGNRIYNGGGTEIVRMAFNGGTPFEAPLVKILFSALSLGCGLKGGEVAPALFVGATLGADFAAIFNLSPGLCAACGMGALFCGITNCPIAALLICFELFGYEGMLYYILVITISFAFSGHYSIYTAQKYV